MSQYLQPAQHHTQLARLSLAKFSHTTTSLNHRGPFNWNHTFGNGSLIGVFERISTSLLVPTSLVLRVTQGHEVLEEIDIAYFVRESNAQPQANQHVTPKPAFAVVVKSPCLAVKYPRGEVWIRRFQIKFSLDRDYYTSLSILSDINCPFTESNPSPIPSALSRNPTSSQWPLYPPSSIPPTRGSLITNSGIDNRPISSNATLPLYPQSTAIPTTTSSVRTGSLPPSSSATIRTAPTDYASSISSGQRLAPEVHTHNQPIGPSINAINQNPDYTPATDPRPTPIACHDTQSLNKILPPKRQLPFSKPGAKRACTGLERPSTSPPTQTGAINNKEQPQGAKPDNSRSGTHAPPTNHSEAPIQSSKVVVLKFQTNPPPHTSTTEENVPAAPSILRQNAQPISAPGTSMSIPDQSNITQERQQRAQTLGGISPSDLSSYLSAPTRERTTQLENWICTHLEDDGFLQLCQDIEGIWGRFALGK